MRFVGEASTGASVFVDDDLDNPRMVASRCPQCGDVRYPARVLCPNDLTECVEHSLVGHGTIYEAVRIALAPQGFIAPYWVGYVDFDEGPRVFAQIAHDSNDSIPTHGDRVELTAALLGTGDSAAYGPLFRRVKSSAGT